ncbi:polysaccharide biosynthesis/export family protein [Methylotenera sp.]|uniref:polysaccharide biosynthesis/export family protein n=1 Tax=Methylotenera sp. TaxID=2051956 RepID=UPI002489EEC0|nr:polysaccharide biosynthesis/export family protein [Methylotenera sp.]MDI1297799.1 polysaccharide biosynthesis/export family protein [Methylotenera sp.]
MKIFKLFCLSLALSGLLGGCAHTLPGSHLIVPGKAMQKIDPKTINSATDLYHLSPKDVILVQIEPLEFGSSARKLEKGNQLHIGFAQNSDSSYKLAPGDELTLELPDEAEGVYQVMVNPDGRITLPRVGKSIAASGMTLTELNKKSQSSYKDLYVTPKVSWALTHSFGEQLIRMTGDYSVGSEGDVMLPGLGSFDVLGKSVQEVEHTLTTAVSKKFNNEIVASVSAAKVNTREQVDTRLTPSGLLINTNLSNLPTRVAEDGSVYIANYGDVPAEGKTVAELKAEITQRLQPNYQNPIVVNVAVQEYAEYNVYIGGEVRYPGRYPFSKKLSMLKLIAQAGWGNENADLANVLLLRPGKDNEYIIYQTNLDEIIEGQASGAQDLKINPQDLIILPPTGIAKANRYIAQYVRGILPFGTNVSYNINSSPSTR